MEKHRGIGMEEYITDEQFQTLLEDIQHKLENGKQQECHDMLEQILLDAQENKKYIDRTYIGDLKNKKRLSRIREINRMLEDMTNEQVENIHSYTVDEYDEPNHAAEALEAIVKMSRKINGKEKDV